MNLKSFEKEINSKILQRGIDYHNQKNIIKLTETSKNEWHALVKGTETYNITIKIENDTITHSTCDCPYEMGPVCKHLVAVFMEIRNPTTESSNNKKSKPAENDKNPNLNELLKLQTKEELIQVILKQSDDSQTFHNYLIARYTSDNSNENKTSYKKYLRTFINKAKDSHGFIHYRNAAYAADGAYQLINDSNDALSNNEYEKAISMAQAVIEVIPATLQYTDDSAGHQGDVIHAAFNILFDIIHEELPQKIIKKLFTYCLKESEKQVYHDYSDWLCYLIELATELSSSENEMNQLLQKLESYIKDCSNDDYSSFKLQKFCIFKYDLLVKMNQNTHAENFFNSCLKFPDFRKRALERELKNKNYDLVIDLALEGEKKDTEARFPGLVWEWKKWRFNAYKQKEDIDEIKKLSYEFILDDNNIEYYEEYKKSIPADEWEETYENLKNDMLKKARNSFSNIHADILVKENELQALADLLKNEPYHVSSYGKHLLPSHSQEVYQLHMTNLRKEASQASDRKKYRWTCKDIKELKNLGGVKEANILIEEFRKKYANRPAFLDELSKL